ncbi:Activin_recp domain-containing protein [Caenorhabditis elegans]|uniref:Activin_recp domain-containing protein n=1 Tax=Caenorhabditis elegans TaxID=6239 RepID=A0A3P6NPF5_CAEEL|nr:Activin_recp domain-containing protein [Caenorhabditis elegans]VDJ66176.1 Activin_recp domain-containing protein [Caenorhabditis elegans]|eukprot:NP_001355542.1 Uncharacterized protein CELE_F39B3.7 [Caenorhabditis elegans]
MSRFRGLLKSVLVSLTIIGTYQQVQIKCYDCVTPLGVDDATEFCNASLYCKGMYCTKGPDALSNGIYHGCMDNPPIDTAGATCKVVTNSLGTHSNCFCKNIDFCNETPAARESHLLLIFVLIILTFFYIFSQ